MKKRRIKSFNAYRASLIVTLITLVFAMSSTGYYCRNLLADILCNKSSADKGEVVIIAIDDYAMKEFGPLPWSYHSMADLIERLNSDESNRPAAIGINAILDDDFEVEEDQMLLQSFNKYENIVLACSAKFNEEISVNSTGDLSIDTSNVYRVHMPNEIFAEKIGHVNAVPDEDGVLRHHLWSFDVDGKTVESMPYELYKLYSEYSHKEADFMPTMNQDGLWHVDFSRFPGGYHTYSAADIIYGHYTPENLRGKIVYIGAYDTNLSDYYITPMSRTERMYTVEYLANVTDAMIAGSDKAHMVKESVISSLILTFILTYLFLNMKLSKVFIATLSIILGGVFFTNLLYFLGYVVDIFTIILGTCFALFTSVMNSYLYERGNKHNMMQTFSRYLDESIVDELLKGDPDNIKLEGKEYTIAVMFVDIRGFTSLSENLEPHEVVNVLNKFLTLTSRCIKRNGGTLDKFMGDGTMAFWGAPLACEDAAVKACKAALEMMEEIQNVAGDKNITMGIGIHYGNAIVGNIGSIDHMDFTAIGNTVNTASRIESLSKGNSISVSQEIIDRIKDQFDYIPYESKSKLKGKSEPIQIYQLIGEKI